MDTTKHIPNEPPVTEVEPSSKGTYLSLAVVGAVIVMTYILLYGLYMARV